MPDWDDLREKQRRDDFRARHGLPPEEEVRDRDRHGDVRHAMHAGHSTHRPLSRDYEQIGLAGEQAFAEFMGVDWDRELRPHGSNSINFRFPGGTVNVYTAKLPKFLLVEVGKAKADFYVLCQYRGGLAASFMGWASRKEVLAAPVGDKGKRGIDSHYIPWERLKPMEQLRDILAPPEPEPTQGTLL